MVRVHNHTAGLTMAYKKLSDAMSGKPPPPKPAPPTQVIGKPVKHSNERSKDPVVQAEIAKRMAAQAAAAKAAENVVPQITRPKR